MIFLILFTLPNCIQSRTPDHIYRIKEELPVHHIIGYLSNDILKFRTPESNVYEILNTREKGVHCFHLDKTSSKLSIASRIDREVLCLPTSMNCYITLRVTLHGTFSFMTIRIEIDDINDHSPIWKFNKYKVVFNDGEHPGSQKSIPYASDLDIGENGHIKYHLESASDTFTLVQEHGLYIKTLKQLDREHKGNYELTIISTDKGTSPLSGRLELDVEILDINDNTPRFTTSIFRPTKNIPETIPVGSVILTLMASDADAGQNGEFSFSFSPTDASVAKSYFFVKPNGEIVVQRQLDYESGIHKFDFKVIVKDHASPGYERSSESRVEIVISDENDEQPLIKIYPIRSNPETGLPIIDENKPLGTPVALVQASDKDYKDADTVTCTTDNFGNLESLSLSPTNDNNDYKLVTARILDRETEQKISVRIACTDGVNHKSFANFTVEIGDVNDNPPKFNDNIFHLYIKENMDVGTIVKNTISAKDKDRGDNGFITYSIPSSDKIPFTIEPQSGILRSKVRLDREEKDVHQFLVIATDHGKPPLSSSAKVVIYVEDENDNPVVMDLYPNEFKVKENLPPNTLVGLVSAKDNDNQTIYFNLDEIVESSKFKIDRTSGKIVTKTKLDREAQSKYQFRVFATDKYYTASSIVTVHVEDINDNAPVFKMPNTSHNSITLSFKETVGYSLTKIIAEDPDDKESSQIQYSIANEKRYSFFTLQKDTGILYLETSPYGIALDGRDHYSLDLEACDMGKPRLCTTFKGFRINIQKNEELTANKGQPNLPIDGSGMSENIIIALISFLLLMIIVTIFIIFLLRKKSRNHSKSSKEPQNTISTSIPYFQNGNGKPNIEFDQCSVEICELTSRLSPECETSAPINQLPYYNMSDQYQCGNFISATADHSYRIPMMLNYNSQIAEHRSMKSIPENLGYYTKYEISESNKLSDDMSPNLTSSDIVTFSSQTPSQKLKSTATNFPRKPQSSFV